MRRKDGGVQREQRWLQEEIEKVRGEIRELEAGEEKEARGTTASAAVDVAPAVVTAATGPPTRWNEGPGSPQASHT